MHEFRSAIGVLMTLSPVATRTVLQNFRKTYVSLPRVISCNVLSDDGQSRNSVELGPTTSVVVTDVDSAVVVVGVSLALALADTLVDTTPSEVGFVVEVEAADSEELSAD